MHNFFLQLGICSLFLWYLLIHQCCQNLVSCMIVNRTSHRHSNITLRLELIPNMWFAWFIFCTYHKNYTFPLLIPGVLISIVMFPPCQTNSTIEPAFFFKLFWARNLELFHLPLIHTFIHSDCFLRVEVGFTVYFIFHEYVGVLWCLFKEIR